MQSLPRETQVLQKGDGSVDIGTVFIAIATPERVFSEKFEFGKNRERTVNRAVNKSFELLYNELLS